MTLEDRVHALRLRLFRRLVDGVKNARQDAKRFPEIEKARRHIDKADELLTEMSAYYAVGS